MKVRGLKPNTVPSGVNGKINVITAIDKVAINRYFPGRLLKKGLRLRMTRTIIDADITDSRNQPVRNSPSLAWSMSKSNPKVR